MFEKPPAVRSAFAVKPIWVPTFTVRTTVDARLSGTPVSPTRRPATETESVIEGLFAPASALPAFGENAKEPLPSAPGASVAENLVSTKLLDRRFVRSGLLDLKAIRANAQALIERFSIRVGGPGAPVATLSGGNMQKVVVARELAEQPKLLLVAQPTRGVDLGATQFIWKTIANARDSGAAVLLTSADLSELLALSDRLLVFYRGKIVAAFRNSEAVSPETLGTYMLGLKTQTEDEMKAGLA